MGDKSSLIMLNLPHVRQSRKGGLWSVYRVPKNEQFLSSLEPIAQLTCKRKKKIDSDKKKEVKEDDDEDDENPPSKVMRLEESSDSEMEESSDSDLNDCDEEGGRRKKTKR